MEILAPQTLVNCVKNPNECGGTGGCEGATEEIAFNYGWIKKEHIKKQIQFYGNCDYSKYLKKII